LNLAKAEKIAKLFIREKSHLFKRIAIVGSVRRKDEEVKDLDFIAIHKTPSLVKIDKFIWHGAKINIFYATPKSWGSMMLWFTGPKGSNLGLVRWYAMRHKPSLKLSPYGVFNRASGKYLGGRTEEEVAKLLGWKWKAPELRGH
jgi:DNA polymerase/3'-5' exonuclease PolX